MAATAGGVGAALGAAWADLAAQDRKLDKALRASRIFSEFLPPTAKPKKRLQALLAFIGACARVRARARSDLAPSAHRL
jgi:hypothetical protein